MVVRDETSGTGVGEAAPDTFAVSTLGPEAGGCVAGTDPLVGWMGLMVMAFGTQVIKRKA